jgi:hypothetical protein
MGVHMARFQPLKAVLAGVRASDHDMEYTCSCSHRFTVVRSAQRLRGASKWLPIGVGGLHVQWLDGQGVHVHRPRHNIHLWLSLQLYCSPAPQSLPSRPAEAL